jgi:hypothetical protein
MRAFKSILLTTLVFSFLTFFPAPASAGPGDYTLTALGGPSFNLKDWHNQARIGGQFDYDLGYSMGFGMMALFGVSDKFRFQLMPLFRYEYLYLGPAALYGIFGAGYGVYDKENAFDLRFGTGIALPLGDRFVFNTDANLNVSPVGLPGTVVTLDWLIGFGLRFH